MKRTLAILLSLIMILTLSACADDEKPDAPLVSGDNVQSEDINESVVDPAPEAVEIIASALNEIGYEIADIYTQEVDTDSFVHKIMDYYIIELENDENVFVTVFEDSKKAAEHAECYNEDGSHYNSSKVSMIIDYAAPVRMWLYEECVIEYGSFGRELYLPLCELFGEPFVGKTDIIKELETSDIQYIRTNEYAELVYPRTVKITSYEELMDYYDSSKELLDLERKTTVYSDTTIGFLDACDTYTAEWFETNDLVMAVLQEGSGSIRHKVTSVTLRANDLSSITSESTKMQINIQTIVPEVGTCDMAQWHIMIGVPKGIDHGEIVIGINEMWDTDFGEMIEESSDAYEYYEVDILDDSSSGEPQNYDDLVEFLENYDNLTFISYEIVYVYSADEAFKLTELDSVLRNTTLYKVHVYYDHISDCKTSYYLNLAHAGDSDTQYYGFPAYQIGQRFISAVFGSSETWRVPVGELEFVLLSKDGKEFAYHLGNSNIIISDESYDGLQLPMDDSETTLLTSTINNPMIFTQKSSSNDLSDFIRKDWAERGMCSAT